MFLEQQLTANSLTLIEANKKDEIKPPNDTWCLHPVIHPVQWYTAGLIDRFRLDQNTPSPFSSLTQHAHSLFLSSHHAVGRNDLPKRVSLFQTESVYMLLSNLPKYDLMEHTRI